MKFIQNLSTAKIVAFVITLLILASIPLAVVLVSQRQEIRKKAVEAGDGQLVCDSGTDPYNSTTITVTNKTTETINDLTSNVFRCVYRPGKVVKSFYSCETAEECAIKAQDGNTHCDVGVWDQSATQFDIVLAPGQSRTFTVTTNACEITQLDAYNNAEHPNDDPTECYNIQSQYTNPLPPNRWPGGFSFAIKENSTGYDATTETCPQTSTPTPTGVTSTSTPTPTGPRPTNSPTPTGPRPTATPTGVRTPTPTGRTPTPTTRLNPTATPIPTAPPGSTPTPTPAQPVSGNISTTIITIVGGGILLLLGLLL